MSAARESERERERDRERERQRDRDRGRDDNCREAVTMALSGLAASLVLIPSIKSMSTKRKASQISVLQDRF